MSRPLVPCPSCRRHVRAGEASCPFCKATFAEALAAPSPGPVVSSSRPLSRAALLFAAATLGASCKTTEEHVVLYGPPPIPEPQPPPVTPPGADAQAAVTVYGPAPIPPTPNPADHDGGGPKL
jgi:hypothetical protein